MQRTPLSTTLESSRSLGSVPRVVVYPPSAGLLDRLEPRWEAPPPSVIAYSLLDPPRLLPDQLSLFHHFKPQNVFIVVSKVSLLTLANRLNVVTKRVEELEKDEHGLDEVELLDIFSPTRMDHELNLWKSFLGKIRVGVARELTVQSVLRFLEHAVVFEFGYRVARSATKQLATSALRKTARGVTGLTLCRKMFATALKSQSLYWFSLFTVSCGFDLAEEYDAYRVTRNTARISKRFKLNALRCLSGCVFASLGASIGSLVRPGLGTTLGSLFFTQASWVFWSGVQI